MGKTVIHGEPDGQPFDSALGGLFKRVLPHMLRIGEAFADSLGALQDNGFA